MSGSDGCFFSFYILAQLSHILLGGQAALLQLVKLRRQLLLLGFPVRNLGYQFLNPFVNQAALFGTLSHPLV